MNRTAQFLIGIVSVALALAAGYYGRSVYLKQVSTYQVPVPVMDIPAYTILTADAFEMKDMPRSMADMAYYQTLNDLVGKISTVTIPAKLPVPLANAEPSDSFRLADANLEVVSIPVEPVSAVGGQIKIGDRINLYQMVINEEATEESKSSQVQYIVEQIAASVFVVDTRTSSGGETTTNTSTSNGGLLSSSSSTQTEETQILTLALEPDQVQTVLEAVTASKKQGGLLWTSLAIP